MKAGQDYLREGQKFITSQYWNSGIRITAGVMVPLLVLVQYNWLTIGIPFLWGALFVSLTDTPGPIHHRRNGMIAAILLNTIVVLITALTKEYQVLLVLQIVAGAFLLSMAGIYGARAGAVGVLGLIVMLLNLLSIREEHNLYLDSLLVCSGGLWYMMFSLLLYRLRPYRVVEQALGEHLISIADYIKARGSFYKDGADLPSCFNRLMEAQSAVQKIQNQTQELLFKTRKFVADASPKSRSSMMIYLDSLDLFEETMYSYQDYSMLHQTLGKTNMLSRFYGVVLLLAAELEHVGMGVQAGVAVSRNVDIDKKLASLQDLVQSQYTDDPEVMKALHALEKTIVNIKYIASRINKLILYTGHKSEELDTVGVEQQISNSAVSQPITLRLLWENVTLKSDTFRHALRITSAIIVAYGISMVFSLHHTYWVLLTIVAIMKPLYSVTRERNIARVTGTLVGILFVFLILYFITNTTFLLVIMILSMLLGYSLLRVNYFLFVAFVTVFVVISFHFLNPLEFKTIVQERMVDTGVGSVIAFLASRYIFPVWGHEEIQESMRKMLTETRVYLHSAWYALKQKETETPEYESARQNAVVALTNLSENFQRMLAEPQQSRESESIHQFVIASHMLTGHIAALSVERIKSHQALSDDYEELVKQIELELQWAEDHLKNEPTSRQPIPHYVLPSTQNTTLNQLSIIYTLARDINRVTRTLKKSEAFKMNASTPEI